MGEPQMYDTVVERLSHAAVTLLADPSHPTWAAQLDVDPEVPVVIELAGEDDRQRQLAAPDGSLVVRVLGEERKPCTLFVPWDSVFCVAAPGHEPPSAKGNGGTAILLREAVVPASMGGREGVRKALLYLGIAEPRPEDIEHWRLGPSKELLMASEDRSRFVADKRVAIEQLLHVPGARVALIVSGRPHSLVVAHDSAFPRPEILPDMLSVTITSHEGEEVPVEVPWERVGAVREVRSGEGWFWPEDLPPGALVEMKRRDMAWWTLVRGEYGVPIEPAAPPPLQFLADAPEGDAGTAARRCKLLGSAVVVADTSELANALPQDLVDQKVLAIPLEIPSRPIPFEPGADALRTAVLDNEGALRSVTLPWSCIFAVVCRRGASQVQVWPERYPQLVHDVIRARELMESGEGVPDDLLAAEGLDHLAIHEPRTVAPSEDGPIVGIDDETGAAVLMLRQRMGRSVSGEPLWFDMVLQLDGGGGA